MSSPLIPFQANIERPIEDERDTRMRLESATRAAAIRASWRRATVGQADITEHIAAMFDALVGSLDWGSGFLETETIESILIVGEVIGFDMDAADHGAPGWRAQVKAKAAAMLQGDDRLYVTGDA